MLNASQVPGAAFSFIPLMSKCMICEAKHHWDC
jgi:hypothetical protein